jgi:hypothetical protein
MLHFCPSSASPESTQVVGILVLSNAINGSQLFDICVDHKSNVNLIDINYKDIISVE